MPTGYTEGVATGKITEFTEYALQCARAFGATVLLRDDPISGEIPEFEPSEYHSTALKEAEQKLAAFLAMSSEQRMKLQTSEHKKNLKAAEDGIAKNKQQRERYEAMLAKAKAFVPPSSEHERYAAFLVTQLQDSIKFDCNDSYYEGLKREVPFAVWQSEKLKKLMRDVEYHQKEAAAELERTAERNKWVSDLKEALGAMSAVT